MPAGDGKIGNLFLQCMYFVLLPDGKLLLIDEQAHI
jgi:hypothetical protein